MSKFDLTKKIPLEYEGWIDCYLEFSLPSYGDLKDLTTEGTDQEKAEKGLETLIGLFRSGFAMSESKRVEVKKEDLKDIPIEVLLKCLKAVTGEIPPK